MKNRKKYPGNIMLVAVNIFERAMYGTDCDIS